MINDIDIWQAFGVAKPHKPVRAPRKRKPTRKVKPCPARARIESNEQEATVQEHSFTVNWADDGTWRLFKAVEEPEALDLTNLEGWMESLWS